MSWDWVTLTSRISTLEASGSRSNHPGSNESARSGVQVNDTRTGEICVAHSLEPSAVVPAPSTQDRIGHSYITSFSFFFWWFEIWFSISILYHCSISYQFAKCRRWNNMGDAFVRPFHRSPKCWPCLRKSFDTGRMPI